MKWPILFLFSFNLYSRCPSFNEMAARLEGIQDGTPISVNTIDGDSIEGVVEQVLFDPVQQKQYVVFMDKRGHRFTHWMTDLNPTTFNAPIDNVAADSVIRFRSKSGNTYEGRLLARRTHNGEDVFVFENNQGLVTNVRVSRVNEASIQIIDQPLTALQLEGNAFRQTSQITSGDFVSVETGVGRFPARVTELRQGVGGTNVKIDVLQADGSIIKLEARGDMIDSIRLSQSSRQQFATTFPSTVSRAPPPIPPRIPPPIEGPPPRISSSPQLSRAPPRPVGPRPQGLSEVLNPGSGGTQAIERLHDLGLYPTEEIIVNGGAIKVGKLFQLDDGGRVGAYMLVNVDGKETLRFAYRSSSQGTFRILPATNDFRSPFVPGYDKGIGEFALEVPLDVQRQLSTQLTRGPPVTRVEGAEELLSSTVETNRDLQGWLAYRDSPSHIGRQVTSRQVAPNLEAVMKSRNPRDVVIEGSAAPDFSPSRMITSYKTRSAIAGDIDVMVFPSRDGQITYTLMKDSEGKVWIGNATSNDPITNFGVPSQGIDLGAAAMPRWEYSSQIPSGSVGRASPVKSSYHDSWSFLRETPVIQDYYRSQGLPVPQ